MMLFFGVFYMKRDKKTIHWDVRVTPELDEKIKRLAGGKSPALYLRNIAESL